MIAAFNDLMQRLEQNLLAQQRFIADAAHQMRTPLTGLKAQAELALAERDPEELRTSLACIGASTDRAAHLINQLLSLARAEASFEKIHAVEPVDLNELAREVGADLAPKALARSLDFGFELSGAPVEVEGNRLLLRELARNLIDNAIKYTPARGRVTVRVRGSDLACLEVEDDGIGIAGPERSRVFERFYRALGTGAEGSGLGLPIVREIAALHRGSVSIEDPPSGRGSLFTVVFPRLRRASVDARAPPGAFPLA